MIDYKWSISELLTVQQDAGFNDVVVIVQWLYTGTEGGYSATIGGSCNYGVNPHQPFTPFNELTEQEVIRWVTSSISPQQLTNLQSNIQQKIEQQKNPPPLPEPQPLPWTQE